MTIYHHRSAGGLPGTTITSQLGCYPYSLLYDITLDYTVHIAKVIDVMDYTRGRKHSNWFIRFFSKEKHGSHHLLWHLSSCRLFAIRCNRLLIINIIINIRSNKSFAYLVYKSPKQWKERQWVYTFPKLITLGGLTNWCGSVLIAQV